MTISTRSISWIIFLASKWGRRSAVINFFLSRRTLHAIMEIFEKLFLSRFFIVVSFLVAPLCPLVSSFGVSVDAQSSTRCRYIVLSYPNVDTLSGLGIVRKLAWRNLKAGNVKPGTPLIQHQPQILEFLRLPFAVVLFTL